MPERHEDLEVCHYSFHYHALHYADRRPFNLPGDTRHDARDRTVDIQNISLDLGLDLEAGKVAGTATIVLAPIVEGVRTVTLDAVDLTVHSIRQNGRNLPFDNDGKELIVHLGRPRKPGRSITLAIDYEATPRRGLYFNRPDADYPDRPWQAWSQGEDEDSRHWFPCYDYPNDRVTSELRVTVPAPHVVLSNGRLAQVSEDSADNTKTYHWKQEQPHATYLITLVAGEFSVIEESVDGIPVQYYVPKGREEDAQRALGQTPDILRFFADKIGVPYPWSKYAQVTVADFIFGGMENTTATTLTDTILHDKRAHLDFTAVPLVAHEAAHQWYGDLLTCRDWAHAWLNEGFAVYFELLYKEHSEGVDEFVYARMQDAESYYSEDRGRYRRPIVCSTYDQPIDLFDRHLYEKGGLVLHMLRFVLGDTLFFKALNWYATKYSNQSVVTTDFQKAIEEATGRSLDWFFQQWVYSGGYPELKAEYSWDGEHKVATIKLSQSQETDQLTPLFQMPVDIAFHTQRAGRQTFRVEIKEKEQSFHFPLTERPQFVQFDPGNHIIKSLDFKKPKDMLIAQLRKDEEVSGRIEAARGLGKESSGDATSALKEALFNDHFWGVQAEAARALGNIKTEASLEALIKGCRVSHPKARRAVADALGEFKSEPAGQALTEMLDQDESYYVAATAARSLGKTRSSKAFEVLKGAMGRDSHNNVISAGALAGMAELREEPAIPVALEWTTRGRPQRVREGAIAALSKLGNELDSHKNEIRERLSELLEDPWLRIKTSAISALTRLEDHRAISPLQRLAERELDGRVVRMTREAINSIREKRTGNAETKGLQEDMDRLQRDNLQLKERLEKLESRLSAKK